MPRIAATKEPDGVAADWLNNVDDGSTLLVSVVASPALQTVASASGNTLTVNYGETFQPPTGFRSLTSDDGQFHSLGDGFVNDPDGKLQDLGIPDVGAQWFMTGMTVLSNHFYRPPNEFDLSPGTDTDMERRIPLAVQVQLDGNVIAQGGKPQGLLLTRAPLVLVHGINSGPSVWDDTSGGQSFSAAVEAAGYPTTFLADHTGADPNFPNAGPTHGEGEIADMYKLVEQEITTATAAYRSGKYFSANPYSAGGGAVIADQKVDVVAHSYGGLLTRWYMEQSGDFASRRDVRKLIELGTPNLGSPLANMVDEIYRNPLIGNSYENQFHKYPLKDLLSALNDAATKKERWAFISTPDGTNPFPFFEDASVGSGRINQLNANPFSNDVAYAAAVGTNPVVANLTFAGFNFLSVAPYSAFQPIDPTLRESYFPWLSQFDGSNTDSVVPSWSAALGVPAYNFSVNVNHVSLVQNSSVQSQVLQWLNDPNVPLGSAQRAAWNNQPPPSDRNAYQGATVNPSTGTVTGGGLSPTAIVGVSFPGTGLGVATFGTTPNQVAFQLPTLTGMIPYGDIGKQSIKLVAVDDEATNGDSPETPVTLQDIVPGGAVPASAFTIDPAQVHPSATDWVAFSARIGTVGRKHANILTGPAAQASWTAPSEGIIYEMPDLPGGSPVTHVSLPDFTLPQPAHSGLTVFFSGAVEWQVPSANFRAHVEIRSEGAVFGSNLLADLPSISVQDPSSALTGTVWDGLLVPYSSQVTLSTDSSGDVYGPDGNSGEAHPQVFQRLDERRGVTDEDSLSTGL